MNVVFLSPEFPSHYYRFCVQLRGVGATVLGIGQTPHQNLRPELRESLHEYYQVPDLHLYDELVRALGYFTWRYGRLDRIDSLNEHWLETEARLRDDFGIEGLRARDVAAVKRKSKMKEVFRNSGLPVARGHLYCDAVQAGAFLRATGYPVVAKPDVGVGANATVIIHNDDEAENFLRGTPDGYFFEEYVEGLIQTFDGLADSDGNPLYYTSMQYRGTLDMVRDIIDTSYFTLRRVPDDLVHFGHATLTGFNVRSRFFHFEYFRRPDGSLLPLEVNVRPPGGLSVDMFNYSSDADLYRLWACMIMGRAAGFTYDRPYHCGYVGRKSYKPYRHTHDEILRRCNGHLVAHQPMDPVFHTAMGDYGYVIRSPRVEEILELTEFILSKQ
jgi:hypothetical protein